MYYFAGVFRFAGRALAATALIVAIGGAAQALYDVGPGEIPGKPALLAPQVVAANVRSLRAYTPGSGDGGRLISSFARAIADPVNDLFVGRLTGHALDQAGVDST